MVKTLAAIWYVFNITHVRPHCPPSYLCTASYDPHFLEIEQLHLCTRLHRQIRTIVGYLLKNSARLILSAALDVTDFIKATGLTTFNVASVMVRGAAMFLGILESKNWPECLQKLVHMLDVPNADQLEVRATISVPSAFLPSSSRPAVSRALHMCRSWLQSHMEILQGHWLLSLCAGAAYCPTCSSFCPPLDTHGIGDTHSYLP